MSEKETWEFINSFAPWFSAFGTLTAVILAIYLARRDKNIRLEISAGHREAQIVNIGWKIGFFKKEYSIQTLIPNDQISSPMPVRLKDGEEAKYFIPLNEETKWIENIIQKSLQPNPRIKISFMKLQVFTSVGKTFNSRIENGLKKRILKDDTE